MKRLMTLAIVIVTLGFWVSASSADYINLPVKWSQLPQTGGIPSVWWSGAWGFEDAPFLVSNDWQCDGSGPVVALRWWGTYGKFPSPPGTPPPSFFVWIHANNPGPPSKPAELITTYQLTPQEAYVGEYDVMGGGVILDPILYRYDAYLPTPFQQEKGKIYWLTIAANLWDLPGGQWYRWEAINLLIDTSVMTSDFITYNRLVDGLTGTLQKDVSFEVMTPIPGSLLLLGSGLLGLAALGRRRRKASGLKEIAGLPGKGNSGFSGY